VNLASDNHVLPKRCLFKNDFKLDSDPDSDPWLIQADLTTAGMGEGPPASDFQSATPLVRALLQARGEGHVKRCASPFLLRRERHLILPCSSQGRVPVRFR